PFVVAVASPRSRASNLPPGGTPFSLETDSTTSSTSLLIVCLAYRHPLGPLEPEICSKPRNDMALVNTVQGQQVFTIFYVKNHIIAFHPADDTLKIAAPVVGNPQADLSLFGCIGSILLQGEQREVLPGRGYLQGIVASDGIFHVQHRAGLATHGRAGFHTDTLRVINIYPQQAVTPLREKFDPPATIAQSLDHRDQHVLHLGKLAGQIQPPFFTNKKWA